MAEVDSQMLISAEIRWFWAGSCPSVVKNWYETSGLQPGGGKLPARIDRYYHTKGFVDLGVKVRAETNHPSPDVEIKGRVLTAPGTRWGIGFPEVEVWCKWKAPALSAAASIVVEKVRRMRKLDLSGDQPAEMRLDEDEKPTGGIELPKIGCNVEFTEVRVRGRPEPWWTLGLEAFGDLESAPVALAAAVRWLGPFPELPAESVSYPKWLDALSL